MMKNYDKSVEINHNPNWSYIPDNFHRILVIAGSGPGKTNVLLNLIKDERPNFYPKSIYTSKIQSNHGINCL